MASQEPLGILKQGVDVWNQWRRTYLDEDAGNMLAYLSYADLSGMNLEGAYLEQISLQHASLREANLRGADLSVSDLGLSDLSRADLSGAVLEGTLLPGADLRNANLSRANLAHANLLKADLSEADLSNADLTSTDLRWTNLKGADFSRAKMERTILGDVDLRLVKGLETVKHYGPSTIGVDVIFRSHGQIPEVFLREAGVPENFLVYARSLSDQVVDYASCFISYSARDEVFAKRLRADLLSNGVRCWFAPEDLKIGAKIRPSIDEFIRLYDKLLLVLSRYSVTSQWVEQEVETALAKERKENRMVLFPIRLDKAVMELEGGWPALIRNTRNIGDFTRWRHSETYQQALDRLLRDLKTETSKPKT